MSPEPRQLAILVSFSGSGGVERVVLNLLQGLAAHDIQVDLLAVVTNKGWLPEIPWPNIRVIEFKAKGSQKALPELMQYLRRERPKVLMVAKDRAVRMSVIAHWLARVDTRLVGQLHMNMTGYLASTPALQRWTRTLPMRWLFPYLNKIVCVSEGVVADTVKITGMPRERVIAIHNPVITPELHRMAEEPVDHPWFKETTVPVIIGVGRLSPEKDFATLIRAFSRVRESRNCRLMILGEGPLQSHLERLINELGLQYCVALPGFRANPFAYMKKAALFVFSSAWEGSGNVLVEALALGVPSVSTDCEYGPRETLEDGRYGPLVPVGDDEALAKAMIDTLDNPLPQQILQQAVTDFTIESSTRRYLDVLFSEVQSK
ncbi:MAG: glycosyltransferase [Methylococcaceae bacterium]|nr:glycosyltransferase [Methylococcaceae bacterium]